MERWGRCGRLALGLSWAVVAAACGGGSDGENVSAQTTQASAATPTSEAGPASTTSAPKTRSTAASTNLKVHPGSMAEWEKLWATQRAAVVKRIKDNGWGLQADNKTVTGPEGFTIDLSTCPAGWSNTEGLTDTTIKIGNPTPLSGTLADAGNISKGAQAVLAHYAAQGAFTDGTGKTRQMDLIIRDDGYDPTRTIPLVDEFMDSDKVFSVWGLGSPSVMKTYDKINERCVPHPFAVTGHPAWGDPVNHPWTTGILMAYNTEAVLWGSFIDEHFDELVGPDGKVTVAALIMNNDFGKSYDGGFKAYLAGSPNKDKINYVTELIEPQAPTVKDPMTSLAAKDPAVFIQMLAGTPCSQSITEASENGMKESAKYLFAASVCKASTYVGDSAVGTSSDGWWIMGGGFRDMNSPGQDDNAFVKWGREILTTAGLDSKSSGNLGTGVSLGWDLTQIFQIAGELPGGLTRANLMVATRALDMTNPMYLEGIGFNLNGNADAYWIEGTEIAKYDHAVQSWVQQGDIIDLSGKSKNCAWDQSTSVCK